MNSVLRGAGHGRPVYDPCSDIHFATIMKYNVLFMGPRNNIIAQSRGDVHMAK